MIFLHVQLTTWQAQSLTRMAAERGIGPAELALEGIEHVLRLPAPKTGATPWGPTRSDAGTFAGGRDDLSEHRDNSLSQAYADLRFDRRIDKIFMDYMQWTAGLLAVYGVVVSVLFIVSNLRH